MVSPYFLRQGVVFAWAYITSHGSQHTLTKNDSDFFYLIFVGIKNPVPLLLKFYDNLLVCQPIIDGYVYLVVLIQRGYQRSARPID